MSSTPLKPPIDPLRDIIATAGRRGIVTSPEEIQEVIYQLKPWPSSMSLTDAIMRELKKRREE